MIRKHLLILIALPWFPLGAADAVAQPAPEVVDWGQCDLKVTQIELVEKLVAGGETLTAGRRDAVLALIKVEGTAPQDGQLSVAPGSFGAQFVFRGVNRIELSRAWGIRSVKPGTGEKIERWTANPDERANVGTKAGESVDMWFAVTLPKEVQQFYVIVPSLIEARMPEQD